MKRLRIVLLVLLAIAPGGCRVRPEQRAILTQYEHDLRRYEDLIYDLEYEYEIVCSENERLKEKLAAVEESGDGTQRDPARILRSHSSAPPKHKPRVKKEVIPEDDLLPPEIESGPMSPMPPMKLTPEVPRTPLPDLTIPPVPPTVPNLKKPSAQSPSTTIEDAPPTLSAPAFSQPASSPQSPASDENEPKSILLKPQQPKAPTAPETLPSPRKERSTSSPRLPELLPEPSDKTVSQLRIDAQHTHGIDLDRHAGDDALHVVLQPLNAAGQLVPAAGKVSIVLLDPTKQGEAARVGRWDFNADFVRYQNHMARNQQLPLDLPWSDVRPESSQLSLFVRYETADGQLVESNDIVQVKLPGNVATQAAWTPRSAHRREAIRSAVAETTAATEKSAMETDILPASHVEEATVSRPEWKPYR